MASQSHTSAQDALRRFRCPVCHGVLEPESQQIACTGCGRLYPVEDGIPVLLRERATPPRTNM